MYAGTLTGYCAHNFQCIKFQRGKNSPKEISGLSQIIFMVTIFGFRLFPYRIFFILDWGNAKRVANLFHADASLSAEFQNAILYCSYCIQCCSPPMLMGIAYPI